MVSGVAQPTVVTATALAAQQDSRYIAVHLATAADIPGIVKAWVEAFNEPEMQELFPSDQWKAKFFEKHVINPDKGEPEPRIVVVRNETGEAIAAAVYFIVHPGQNIAGESWRTRFPSCEDCPGMKEAEPLLQDFFGSMAISHEYVMRNRPHVYLEILMCQEAYRGRGCGGALIQWGNQLADEMGYPLYVDATPRPIPLYERNGYVVQNVDAAHGGKKPDGVSTPLLRDRKS